MATTAASGSQAIKSALPCHMCACPDWKDQSGHGECENKAPNGIICRHPIASHY
jgi:hypothetical protein